MNLMKTKNKKLKLKPDLGEVKYIIFKPENNLLY